VYMHAHTCARAQTHTHTHTHTFNDKKAALKLPCIISNIL